MMHDLQLHRPPDRAARPARPAARRSTSPATTSPTPNTVGYTRQEAVARRRRTRWRSRPARCRPAPARSSARASRSRTTAASATTSSTSSSARRTCARRPRGAPRGARPASRPRFSEPGDNGLNALLGKFWRPGSDVANYPESRRRRQALVDARRSARRRPSAARRPLATVAAEATAELTQLTAAGGPVDAGQRDRRLNGAISERRRAAGRAAQRPARPPRHAARRALAARPGLGRPTSATARSSVDFGDAAAPLVDGTHRRPGRRRSRTPGGQLGALLDAASTDDRARATAPSSTRRRALADERQRARTAPGLLHRHGRHRGDHAHRRDHRRDASRAGSAGAPPAPTTSRSRSPRLRGGARRRPPTPTSSRRIGADARDAPAASRPHAQALVDAVEERRQERLRRLARRGDDQHGPLPARLPGLGPRACRPSTRCSTR